MTRIFAASRPSSSTARSRTNALGTITSSGRPRRAVVGERAERPLAAREELREVEVLHVVERDRARRRDRRDPDRQRVVHGVGVLELGAERAGAGGRERHGSEPLGDRAREPVLGDELRRKALALVGSRGRQVDAVGERPDPRQRPQQLAGRRLAAAELARDEREQGDPDHARGRLPRRGAGVRSRRAAASSSALRWAASASP